MTDSQKLLHLFDHPVAPEADKRSGINKVDYCGVCSKYLKGGQKEIGYCETCDKLSNI